MSDIGYIWLDVLTAYGVSVPLLTVEEALSIDQKYWIQG